MRRRRPRSTRRGDAFLTVSRETQASHYFGESAGKALRYADLLATTAIERGLIGPKEGERIWDRHLLNCLPITTLLAIEGSVADIGSGAGLPGIVIALAKPNLKVTLIEPLARRVEFLFEVADQLDLDIEIVRGKSESITGSFDFVTARAVAPLPRLIEMSWHLVGPKGRLLAMKGESAAEELSSTNLKNVTRSHLHEINLDDLPVSRVIELSKAG